MALMNRKMELEKQEKESIENARKSFERQLDLNA